MPLKRLQEHVSGALTLQGCWEVMADSLLNLQELIMSQTLEQLSVTEQKDARSYLKSVYS